jgi:hypothetical protein
VKATLGPGGYQHLGLGAARRGDEIAAVDDGGGEGAVVDLANPSKSLCRSTG